MKAVMRENSEKNLDLEYSNLSYIETNLWLGNLIAATDIEALKEKKINFILTVNSFPLPKKISDLCFITAKYIKVSDTPRDDLLSYFEEIYEFIEYAVKKGAVLVHCFQGVSRSATAITCYLMKKKNMKMITALNFVKSKRESVEPNLGFLEQLKLYEIMNYTLDRNNIQYKMFRLCTAAYHVKKRNIIPEFYIDVIKTDPLLKAGNTDSIVYKCKKCRRIVAQDSNVIPHVSKEKYTWRNSIWNESLENIVMCQKTYFIEPLIWMKNVAVSLEGKLICPNHTCKNKLGSFNWVTGCQCPCGAHICPGFYLIPSKVDSFKVDQKII